MLKFSISILMFLEILFVFVVILFNPLLPQVVYYQNMVHITSQFQGPSINL